MANAPVEPAAGGNYSPSMGSNAVGDVTRLLAEASSLDAKGGFDKLDDLIRHLDPEQLKEVSKTLEQRGEAISEAEKQALAKNKKEEIQEIVKGQCRRAIEHSRAEAERDKVVAAVSKGDGLTHAGIRRPAESGRQMEHLPSGEGDSRPAPSTRDEAATAGPRAPAAAETKSASLERFPKVHAPLTEAKQITALKMELLQIVVGPAAKSGGSAATPTAAGPGGALPSPATGAAAAAAATASAPATTVPSPAAKPTAAAAGPAAGAAATATTPASRAGLGQPPPATPPGTATSTRPTPDASAAAGGALKDAVLGTSTPPQSYVHGYPPRGRSGEADRLPILQFCPSFLRAAFESAGISSLADFLARAIPAAGREKLAELSGLPRTTVLLAALRGELLDLPPLERKYNPPHTKDTVLLSRLGLGSVATLGKLAPALDQAPARLDLAGELLAAIQKADPECVGRQRLTRHELRSWAQAAARRGSDIEVAQPGAPGSPKSGDIESIAEEVLHWYLGHRFSTSEEVWNELVLRSVAELTSKASMSEKLRRAIEAECDASTRDGVRRLLERRQAGVREEQNTDEAHRTREDEEQLRLEQQRYADFVLECRDWSLFSELAPWVRPAEPRRDGKVCFWMDPVPTHRELFNPRRPEQGAESLKPVYVCLDPVSGAIAPSDAG